MLRHRTSLALAAAATVTLLSAPTSAFVPPCTKAARPTTAAAAWPELFGGNAADQLSPAVEAARGKFWFYFLAGSGAGVIGLAQLPAIFDAAGVARAVVGTGPTKGGAALNAGPLVGIYYDSDISKEDVADAISRAPTAEFISSRSTAENYMASKGYIEKRDFIKEMEAKGCNPLASYVVFDAISSGKGGVVSPVVYEEKLAAYRDGSAGGEVASSFVGDLNGFLAVQAIAFVGLALSLGVDLFLVGKNGIEGFLS